MRRHRGDAPTSVADVADRLAVMLRAGIAPERAWTYLAEVGGGEPVAIAERIAGGTGISDAIRLSGLPWQPLAQAWHVAAEVGAPLTDTLRSLASSARDAAEVADDVRIALAEPAMTAKIMTWLPAAGLLIGLLLGFDTARLLVTNPIAIACAVLGALLMVLAHRWTRKLVRRAQNLPAAPGLRQDLIAIALSGGASVDRALTLVSDVGSEGTDGDRADRALALSRRAGVPAVELLRQDAADERRQTRTTARIGAARLSGQLLIPLGVCSLPAFFLLGVAPMLLSVLTSTSLTW